MHSRHRPSINAGKRSDCRVASVLVGASIRAAVPDTTHGSAYRARAG